MAELKIFEEGEVIYAREINDNFSALQKNNSDFTEEMEKYLEKEIASIQSNVASVQQTLQNNINEVEDIANSKVGAEINKEQSGFCKFSNGLIIQWGRTTSSFSGTKVITLPTPFTSANYTPIACPLVGGDYDANWDVRSITTTSFAIAQHSSGKKNLTWLAIGY